MTYLPRLYNPNPIITQMLYAMGHRVVKEGEKWIYKTPLEWKALERKYDEQKKLNTLSTEQ